MLHSVSNEFFSIFSSIADLKLGVKSRIEFLCVELKRFILVFVIELVVNYAFNECR